MWFSFDGETFETHKTEEAARENAEQAMSFWSDEAADGWSDESRHVVYGKVTHAVRVEKVEVDESNRYLIPQGCDGIESHHLEPVVERSASAGRR